MTILSLGSIPPWSPFHSTSHGLILSPFHSTMVSFCLHSIPRPMVSFCLHSIPPWSHFVSIPFHVPLSHSVSIPFHVPWSHSVSIPFHHGLILSPFHSTTVSFCLHSIPPRSHSVSIPFQSSVANEVSILVPGAGLGRLAFELARHGYMCQGNEFSMFMLLASNFILNR